MVDSAKITLQAGKGGDGKVSFIRTRQNPRGGPDGGNGGRGGDVYLIATHKINTLSFFKTQDLFKAQSGAIGGKNYKSGKSGEDLILQVPIGTVVYSNNKVLFDLSENEQKEFILKGGFGGYGNAKFKSSTNKKPDYATKGKMGEKVSVDLELKLISNIGFIGFPSVGKSTLLNYLVKSSYKTASYPFTTLSPNLGVLHLSNSRSLILADLPGLIEGASEGKGLGDEFLKHTERCAILVHLLDFTQINDWEVLLTSNLSLLISKVIENYKVIRNELSLWSKNLETKKELVLLTKIDSISDSKTKDEYVKKLPKKLGISIIPISAYTGEGIDKLMKYFEQNYNEIIEHSTKSFKRIQKVKSVEINLSNIPNKRLVSRNKSFYSNQNQGL